MSIIVNITKGGTGTGEPAPSLIEKRQIRATKFPVSSSTYGFSVSLEVGGTKFPVSSSLYGILQAGEAGGTKMPLSSSEYIILGVFSRQVAGTKDPVSESIYHFAGTFEEEAGGEKEPVSSSAYSMSDTEFVEAGGDKEPVSSTSYAITQGIKGEEAVGDKEPVSSTDYTLEPASQPDPEVTADWSPAPGTYTSPQQVQASSTHSNMDGQSKTHELRRSIQGESWVTRDSDTVAEGQTATMEDSTSGEFGESITVSFRVRVSHNGHWHYTDTVTYTIDMR